MTFFSRDPQAVQGPVDGRGGARHAGEAAELLQRGVAVVADGLSELRLGGVPESACLAFDGATDAAAFEAYVERCLAPALRPGDIVVMDNLACHKSAEDERLIAAAGAGVRYLPAYSPDLNPIERLFSKLKAALRKAKARTADALIAAMGDGLRSIRSSDILGWFGHSGYG